MMVKDIKNSKENIGIIAYSSIDGITGNRVSFTQKPEIEIDFIESLKGEKFKGEFLFIQKEKCSNFRNGQKKFGVMKV